MQKHKKSHRFLEFSLLEQRFSLKNDTVVLPKNREKTAKKHEFPSKKANCTILAKPLSILYTHFIPTLSILYPRVSLYFSYNYTKNG